MKITVLYGGPGAERDVSLVSGKAVINGLLSVGHEVFASDISPDDLSALDHPADVIFPVLHGQFGESGELQEILERRHLKFVGSSSKASRIGMDKAATKKVWEAAGLPTPPWQYHRPEEKDFPALLKVPPPCVVKAPASGSSVDVYICKTMDRAQDACTKVAARYGVALVEKYIDGPELTVGILEEQPLAPIRIIPHGEFFDYYAKYQADDTEHRFDTGLPPAVIEHCRQVAMRANAVVGARDLARVDIMLDRQSNPYLLEINTLPGFTPKSLLPEGAKHAGIEFGPLVDRLVKRAYARTNGR